jgi:hypothetical protein
MIRKIWKMTNIQTSIKIIKYLESLPLYKYSQKQLSYKNDIKHIKHIKYTKKVNV